jgi:uncharacterized membrane protein
MSKTIVSVEAHVKDSKGNLLASGSLYPVDLDTTSAITIPLNVAEVDTPKFKLKEEVVSKHPDVSRAMRITAWLALITVVAIIILIWEVAKDV